MATWAYKATPTMAGMEFTRRLADNHRFLARTAYYPPKNGRVKPAKAANAWKIETGNTLLLYFGGHEKRSLGAYKVMDPGQSGPSFKRVSQKGAFAAVMGAALKAELVSEPGYEPDPVFSNYVGFVLEPLDIRPPTFEAIRWPNQQTLIRVPWPHE